VIRRFREAPAKAGAFFFVERSREEPSFAVATIGRSHAPLGFGIRFD
jgi:hypothetical protein